MPDAAFVVHLIDLSGLGIHVLKEALVAKDFVVVPLTVDQLSLSAPTPEHPDTIILCLAREDSRGIALCHDLRKAYPRCAICLIHEGLGEWEESVALELGADAVIPRPVNARRAVAQVWAFQRLKGQNRLPQAPRLQLLAGSRTARAH